MKTVTAKLHTMRKAQTFTAQPMSDGRVLVQSDKSIGTFDPATREGVLNTKGAYFPHLSKALGAIDYTYPAEFVAECIAATPTPGGTTSLAGGAVVMHNTITVI